MSHAEFIAAWRDGRLHVHVDAQRAPGFVSARLLLPFLLLPLFGAAVALALLGFVLIGVALGAAALVLRYLVRRSSRGSVLSRSMQKPEFYRDAIADGVLRIEFNGTAAEHREQRQQLTADG